MTLYKSILQKLLAGETKIPLTCTERGKAWLVSIDVQSKYKIVVSFIDTTNVLSEEQCLYTEDGRSVPIAPVSLALGHYDTQLETAQAIAEQNSDTETQQ